MRDTLMSREMSYVIAEGDPGRGYENIFLLHKVDVDWAVELILIQVLLFTFRGSNHTRENRLS